MYEQQKWELRAATAARIGIAATSVELFMFPTHAARTVRVHSPRARRFREYLRKQLAAVAPLRDAQETAKASAGERPETFPLDRVCATCRGQCCRDGADHAYISPRTLERSLVADSALSGETLVEAYLAHVPARSYEGSCIFHTAGGCALPRALRSDICNTYVCASVKAMGASAAAAVIGVFERTARKAPCVMVLHEGRALALRPARWRAVR